MISARGLDETEPKQCKAIQTHSNQPTKPGFLRTHTRCKQQEKQTPKNISRKGNTHTQQYPTERNTSKWWSKTTTTCLFVSAPMKSDHKKKCRDSTSAGARSNCRDQRKHGLPLHGGPLLNLQWHNIQKCFWAPSCLCGFWWSLGKLVCFD